MDAIKIFCCYAHKDRDLQDQLVKHLEPLKRAGQVTTWYDRELLPGTEWKQEIDKHLNTSDIVLLLISPNFMSSDYCYSIEMQKALERHNRKETRVIPVILRPVSWQETPIGKLLALPTDGKPIVRWSDRDEAFQDVVRGIMKVASDIQKIREEDFLSLGAQKAQVIVEIDGKPSVTYPLHKKSIVIGRGRDSDIFISSPRISHIHAIIKWNGKSWIIINASTAAKLLYNGEPIERHVLSDEDSIHLADVAIHFQLIPQNE